MDIFTLVLGILLIVAAGIVFALLPHKREAWKKRNYLRTEFSNKYPGGLEIKKVYRDSVHDPLPAIGVGDWLPLVLIISGVVCICVSC